MNRTFQPVLFVSWSSPLHAIDGSNPLRERLRAFGAELRDVDAAVVVSAHKPRREADRGTLIVNGSARPPLIYDFADYPKELYRIGYPGFGHPELASRVAGRLISAGMKVRLDAERGWDHRLWMPMREILPNGDVPIVDIGASIDGGEEMLQKTGAALSFLRERGILLVAVGGGSSAERFDPLVFALGAARPEDKVVEIHDAASGGKTLALVA